jgi:NAD(P)-dependent dehydrogenase (short-subunit alcohol dehydrogenase family)
MDLQDKVVVITGAARRVGRVIALELATRGAHIAFSWHFDDEPYEQTANEIKALGRRVFYSRCDVSNTDALRAFISQSADALGRLDVLINNASVWMNKPFLEITDAEWDAAMNINVRGPFAASQQAARYMLVNGGGVILNITDLSAFQVWPNNGHHAASKAALASLTKSMAAELAPTIRVNAIAPGTVLLPDGASEAKRQWAEGKSLLKRVGQPEDVAKMAAFLIEMEFITGGIYFVDGGRALV